MSALETLLVFGGIPLAVVLTVYALVYATSGRVARRYRPGRPFSFEPVWYVAAPTDQPGHASGDGDRPAALPAGRPQRALTGGSTATGETMTTVERGGARGTW
jgi:hypothetical protein